MPLRDWEDGHAAAARFHGIAADDLICGAVRPVDENVGLDPADDVEWCVFRKYHDRIDRGESRQDLGALTLWSDWPARSFIAADGLVRVESDDQHVSERARGLEIPHMAGAAGRRPRS